MTEEQKKAIIESGKNSFRISIIPNHIGNLRKLRLKEFDINPFPINYLAASFLCGDTTPQSMANGERISADYKTIATAYPVYCGTEFWDGIIPGMVHEPQPESIRKIGFRFLK